MPQVDKDKRRAYNVEYAIRVREELAALKMNPCGDCGFVPKVPDQMDWDHTTDDKLLSVARFATRGMRQKALAEIKKCELVCANCHRLRTHNRRRMGDGPNGLTELFL